MTPRLRKGEIVRLLAEPGGEGVVDEIAGPDDEGASWNVTVRFGTGVGARGLDSLVLLPEAALEPTGFAEDDRGQRVILDDVPAEDELRTCLELRFFTEIADGIDAARVAEEIERELVDILDGATVSIEAERHWSEPFNYELGVTIVPRGDPVEALRSIADAGGGGWLACRDDGWRCELWWSSAHDDDSILIVPEVHGAEVVFLPWSSPARRPVSERPLVAVDVPETVEEPDYDDPGSEELEA